MKIDITYENIKIKYVDITGVETSCISFSFKTKGLLPLHLYKRIGMSTNIVDESMVLEILKQQLTRRLEHYATKTYGRTFMELFIFSINFIGGIKIFKNIVEIVNDVIHTHIKYVNYAQLCKALKIRYDIDLFKGALYDIEKSIKRQLWVVISGKKVVQTTYKNGESGSQKISDIFEKLEWKPSLGRVYQDIGRVETLWKPLRDHRVLKVSAKYSRQWENIYTPVILYASLLEKLTYPTSPEGYSPAIEPSGYFIYYLTRRPIKQWYRIEDLTNISESKSADLWFHWANSKALLLINSFTDLGSISTFRLPTIYEEIRSIVVDSDKKWE